MTADGAILSDAREVPENTSAGTSIDPVLTTTDPEGNSLTYSLSGTDASSFAIVSVPDGGQLQTRDPLNFETKSEYMVMVTASDGTLYSEPITVTITVTDVNDQPEFDDDRITLEIPEDTGTGVNIDMPVVATDDDGDALTYTIGVSTDASLFDIRREFGQLFSPEDGSLTAQLDYEGAKAFYEIEVEVKDEKADNGLAPTDAVDDTITVIIIVTDEDEAPAFLTLNS